MVRFTVRRRAHAWIPLTLAALVGCGSDSPTDDGGGNGNPVATTSVAVQNNLTFNPSAILVSPGATVNWTWQGGTPHNVTWVSVDLEDSPTQSDGAFSATMPTEPGTYSYYCTIHGTPNSGMRGTVTVQ